MKLFSGILTIVLWVLAISASFAGETTDANFYLLLIIINQLGDIKAAA